MIRGALAAFRWRDAVDILVVAVVAATLEYVPAPRARTSDVRS